MKKRESINTTYASDYHQRSTHDTERRNASTYATTRTNIEFPNLGLPQITK